ncbi:MAG: spore germination protein, partial [Planifilum fulgidum]
MTPVQAQAVMFLFILGTAILNVPVIITALAKQGAWLSVLLAALVGWLAPLMVFTLCQKHQGRSLIEVCLSV